jgi:hypothetical protein
LIPNCSLDFSIWIARISPGDGLWSDRYDNIDAGLLESLRPGDKISTRYEGRGEERSEFGWSIEFVEDILEKELFDPTLGFEGILIL